jgi:DNA polymerase III delta prime subunit
MNSYAQNSDKNLFDNNCLSMVKKNKLVRGNSKYLNDKNKRTERWFAWDKITTRYKGLVENKDISKAAIERYRNYDPLNPPESLLSCRESSGELENCLAFNAYCTEQLTNVGMKEELIEWRDRVQNCRNPNYIAINPEHCQRDFVRSLNYLARNAKEISNIIKSKSPEVSKYFKEAQNTFGEYANELKELNLAQADAVKINELNVKKNIEKEKAFNALRTCDDIVQNSKRDVRGRNITNEILQGASCKITPTVSSDEIQNKLILDLEKVEDHALANELAPKLNEVAIIKSSKALWSTFETFFNENDLVLDEKSETKAVDLICEKDEKLSTFCTEKFKAILKKSYSEYLDLKKHYPIKKVTSSDLSKEKVNSFNAGIKEINRSCQTAKKEAAEIEKTYACLQPFDIGKLSGKKVKAKVLPKRLQAIYDNGQPMNVNKCDLIIDEKYKALKSVQSRVSSISNPAYSKIVQSRIGHLMITDKFREHVGVITPDWAYERCLRGNGFAFKEVSDRDINNGLKDFLKLNYKELADSAFEKENNKNSIDKVKNYLKDNPLTVAELLERNPSEDYAKALCHFIRDINTTDYRRRWVRRGATAVGVVAGIGLSFTGIGTPAGLALLAAVGASTTIEVVSLNKEINEEKLRIIAQKQAAVTFQTDFDSALRKVQESEQNIGQLKTSKKVAVVLGALEIVGSGGIKLIRNFLKTKRGISAGKILGFTSATLTDVKANRFAKDISLAMESIKRNSTKEFRAIFDSLDYEEMIEFSALYSKVDDGFKATLLDKFSDIDSINDLRHFIHSIDGSVDQTRLIALIDDATSVKLADGTVIDGLKGNPDFDISKVINEADITKMNSGVIDPKSFFGRRVASYTKKIDELEDFKKLIDEIPLNKTQKDNFISNLSFLDPKNEKQVMSILSDSKKASNEFINNLKKSGCLAKAYTKNCGEIVQKIISESAKKSLADHKLAKNWLNLQSPEIKGLFKGTNISGADLLLAKKHIPKGTTIKDLETSKNFVDYLSTLPQAQRVEGYKGLKLILTGSKTPNSKVFKKFNARNKIFNGYEKYYYKKVKAAGKSRLKRIAKAKGLNPTKANLDDIAKEEARRFKAKFANKFNACKAGNAKGLQAANLKRFLKFNTASSLGFTVGSYMWVMGSDDDEELVVDKNGDLIKGEPDKDYKALASVLGYELVASYVFSKIPGLVLSGPGNNIAVNSIKDYAAGGGLDYVNTRIFGSIFGINESESKKKLNEMLNDPAKKEALDKLKIYVDKKMKTQKMKKIVNDFQSEFSLFTKDLKVEEDVGYDYLMDNFSSDELASSDELMEAFESSVNEFEYDQKSGDMPISKYVHELTNGKTKISVENDLFYYNLGYNVPSAVKRVFMYSLISNRLCMGRWGEVIAFTAIDKFLSNAAYWAGRKLTVGSAQKLGE